MRSVLVRNEIRQPRYIDVAVPFQIWGNRQVLTAAQLTEHPWLTEFISRWRNCFEYDAFWDIYVFSPEGL